MKDQKTEKYGWSNRVAVIISLLVLVAGISLAQTISTTANSGSFNVTVTQMSFAKDGTITMTASYDGAVTGFPITGRTFFLPYPNGAVVDNNGTQVAASIPLSFRTARDSLLTEAQSLFTTASGAGKLDLK